MVLATHLPVQVKKMYHVIFCAADSMNMLLILHVSDLFSDMLCYNKACITKSLQDTQLWIRNFRIRDF